MKQKRLFTSLWIDNNCAPSLVTITRWTREAEIVQVSNPSKGFWDNVIDLERYPH
jgi:hypothetical protein